MLRYIDAAGKELDQYRFMIVSKEYPQYGAGIKFILEGKNYRKEVLPIRSADAKELDLDSNTKVIVNTQEIPTGLYKVIANLIGLLEKYEIGLIDDPKALEELSTLGNIYVFKV